MIGNRKLGLTRRWGVLALAVVLACGTAGFARGETFTVSNLNDAGPGSLREAIETANSSEGPDVITFAPDLLGTIGLTTGGLKITDDLMIEGPGADLLAVSRTVADPGFRVFFVESGAIVDISGLSISGGEAGYGGGVYNAGTLTVMSCAISRNGAYGWRSDYPYPASGGGGGIYNEGSLMLAHSTLSDNGGGFIGGGGILNRGSSIVVNSTFSGNVALEAGGGGILDLGEGLLLNSTVTNNWTVYPLWSIYLGDGMTTYWIRGEGWTGESGRVEMHNTILAGNGSNDLQGSLAASGYNLIGDAQDARQGFAETDLVGGLYLGTSKNGKSIFTEPIDPKLAPLADNGGPTWTHALYLGSPAIDAGDPGFVPPPDTDQRGDGFPRVLNSRIDIGAFEGAIDSPPPPKKKK